MRRITLTRGKVALIDDEDYENVAKHRWYALKIEKNGREYWYASRVTSTAEGRRRLFMHREILNAPPGLVPDHIDFNGLNNRRSNLRLITRSQNSQWRHGVKGSSSKYKGVTWARRYGLWMAGIKYKGRSYTLGYFKSQKTAALMYDVAAQILFGEFAYINGV